MLYGKAIHKTLHFNQRKNTCFRPLQNAQNASNKREACLYSVRKTLVTGRKQTCNLLQVCRKSPINLSATNQKRINTAYLLHVGLYLRIFIHYKALSRSIFPIL